MDKITFDTHTHSTISDGGESPEQMLSAAAELGMEILALTDHFDIHARFPEQLSQFDGAGREESYRLLSALKQREFGGVKFLNGIELAQAHHHKEIAEKWLAAHEYDYVIGSCHVLRGHIDFFHMDYNANPPEVLLKQYFAELLELCEWGGAGLESEGRLRFDSLAHITYPLRYMPPLFRDLNPYSAAIDAVLAAMVKYGIAMEINTGGLPALMNVFRMTAPLLERYRELGGRLITIGSDSHRAGGLTAGIAEGAEMAKSAGFSECFYFEGRNAKSISL